MVLGLCTLQLQREGKVPGQEEERRKERGERREESSPSTMDLKELAEHQTLTTPGKPQDKTEATEKQCGYGAETSTQPERSTQ